jgi:hypothetical protein
MKSVNGEARQQGALLLLDGSIHDDGILLAHCLLACLLGSRCLLGGGCGIRHVIILVVLLGSGIVGGILVDFVIIIVVIAIVIVAIIVVVIVCNLETRVNEGERRE